MKPDKLFQSLKKEFDLALEATENRKYLIEREISSLEKFIYEERRSEGALKYHVYNFKSVFDPYAIGSIFYKVVRDIFDQLQLLKNPEDFVNDNGYHEETVKYTKELFSYYQYLNSIVNTKSIASTKITKLSHKQKLLALHYLGLELKDLENSKVAKVFSAVLDLSEDNTRQYLSYVSAGKNSVRTKNNLQVLHQLFDKAGLNDISDKIEKDLEKIEK